MIEGKKGVGEKKANRETVKIGKIWGKINKKGGEDGKRKN